MSVLSKAQLAKIVRRRLKRLAHDLTRQNPPLTPIEWREVLNKEADAIALLIGAIP